MTAYDLLSTITVLDLSGTLAGAYAGRLLADSGAVVLRPADMPPVDLGDAGTGYSRKAYDALVALLEAGKTPVADVEAALDTADVIIDTGRGRASPRPGLARLVQMRWWSR